MAAKTEIDWLKEAKSGPGELSNSFGGHNFIARSERKKGPISRPFQWLIAAVILVLVGIGFWQNSIKWLFVCEVQWTAAAFLVALPILAVTSERALLLGAYEIETRRQGFLVGLLLTFALSSIVWTAELELGLAEARLREPIGDPRLVNLLGEILLVAGLLLNVSITHAVSNPGRIPGRN